MIAAPAELTEPARRDELEDPKRPELLPLILSGFVWTVASQGISQLVRTGTLVLLARLLTPREFGVAAMAMVASAFVITYSDCGFGLALVQKESITEADRSTVFWASIALGTLMAGVCVAVAPFVARFYHTAEVEPLLDVLALSFFFTGLGSTHRSLQFRAMNFRALQIRTMAATIVGGVATVIVALDGGGAWAIIIGTVVSAAISTFLLLAMGSWRPRFIFSLQSLRDLGGFSLRFVGGSTFTTLNSNADNILVGRVLGQAALGTYNLAYSVILVPLTRIAYPVCQLVAPALARVQNDKPALAANWLRGTRLLLMLFLPLMITVAVTAPDVVHVAFGDKWHSAVPVIRVLAPVSILLSIQGLADAVLQGAGEMRTYLRMRGFSFALNIAAFFIGVQWGLVWMAIAFGISTVIFLVVYFVAVARVIDTSLWRFSASLMGVLAAGAALTLVEIGVYGWLAHTRLAAIGTIAATTVAGVLTFAVFCLWRERDATIEAGRLVARILPVPRRFVPAALQSA